MTRELIIKVAAQLFIDKGYDKTSYNDIISSCGISKGGIYHYFSSKEELMLECVNYLIDRNISEFNVSLNKNITSLAKINAIKNHASKDIHIDNKIPSLFEVTSKEQSKKITIHILEETLIEGIQSGEFRMLEPKIYAHTLFILFDEIKYIESSYFEKFQNLVDDFIYQNIIATDKNV